MNFINIMLRNEMEPAREGEVARERVAGLVNERAPAGSVVVFATQVGSRSYNLQREDGGSDEDFAGIYAAPPSAFWGLARPPANLASGGGAKSEAVVDVQVNEVATFANLLLTGNPAAVEVLCSSLFLANNPLPVCAEG